MSEYRAGQRVRIEWLSGLAVEGTLVKSRDGFCRNPVIYVPACPGYIDPALDDDGRTVTILAKLRPEEPTGLGAVVEAADSPGSPRLRWILVDHEWLWEHGAGCRYGWSHLIDPVILSQGWSE